MLHRPEFKRHLRVEPVEPDRLFLLHEEGHHVIEGRLFVLLAPLLDGQRTVAEIVDALAGRANAVDVGFGLSLLEEEGFVVESTARLPADLVAFAQAVDVEPRMLEQRLRETRISLSCLGSVRAQPLEELLRRHLLELTDREPHLRVVVTDDYLHPGLSRINRRALENGEPWLLLKPVGSVGWLGPLFVPGRPGCWACLAHRLRETRPALRFLERSRNRARPQTPVPSLPTADWVFAEAAVHLLRWVATGEPEDLETAVYTLDLRSSERRRHVVVARARCRWCGTPDSSAHRPGPPPLQAGHGPVVWFEGGWRTALPEETLESYRHHISPLTGIVHSLEERSVRGADGAPQPGVHVWVAEHTFCADPRDRGREHEGWRRPSAGKGASAAQARTSALCEALERYCGIFRGNEARQVARLCDLGEEGIHPRTLLGYSARQYRVREAWNREGTRYTQIPQPFDEEVPIEWSPVWSLTESRTKWVPTAYCYYGYPVTRDHDFCRADSNGNASGNSLGEAFVQGFLELVERDCVAIWWYNRLRRPGVDLESFEAPFFRRLVHQYRQWGRSLLLLDITHDFGIPTFAAVAPGGRATETPLFGFGSHVDPRIAAERALTELNQFLPGALGGSGRRLFTGALEDPSFLLPAEDEPQREEAHYSRPGNVSLTSLVPHCVRLAERRGLEILVLDQTRPDVGLPVVKVIVPGLRHYWARLGPGRLYDVPVALGWRDAKVDEEHLNPCHLVI